MALARAAAMRVVMRLVACFWEFPLVRVLMAGMERVAMRTTMVMTTRSSMSVKARGETREGERGTGKVGGL